MAPPLPPAGSVLKVVTYFQAGSSVDLGAHLYFNYTGSAPDPTGLTELATAINTDAVSALLGLVQTDGDIAGVRVYDLSVSDGPYGQDLTIHTGTRSGAILPVQVAATTNYTIGRRYRGGKPKTFWPFGVASDLAAPNAWSGTAVTDFLAGVNAYIAAISSVVAGGVTVGPQSSVSYFQGFTNESYGTPVKYRRVPTPRVTPQVDLVTGVSVPTRPGSQRRRRVG